MDVVKTPDAAGQRLGREDPPTAQPAEAISLGQAAGDQKAFRIDVKRGFRPRLKKHLFVNLIHQNIRAVTAAQRRRPPFHRG